MTGEPIRGPRMSVAILQCEGKLIFKCHQVVVPQVIRKELLQRTHATYISIEGCICQARETLFWPWMTTETKEYISKCDIYLARWNGQGKGPILQHEFVPHPWAKITADLCDLDNRAVLVISDYNCSNFIEVSRLTVTTSKAIIKELKAVFARFGVPDTLVMDKACSSHQPSLQSLQRHGC